MAASEDDTICLQNGYSLRSISAAPVLAHRGGFIFDILSIFDIIYLTRGPLVSAHLTAGKICTKNSALSYQDEGAIFYA